MDRDTLMAYVGQWGNEAQPVLRDLPRLTVAESALFDALRDKRLHADPLGAKQSGAGVRLEQARIGFEWVKAALAKLPDRFTAVVATAAGLEGK